MAHLSFIFWAVPGWLNEKVKPLLCFLSGSEIVCRPCTLLYHCFYCWSVSKCCCILEFGPFFSSGSLIWLAVSHKVCLCFLCSYQRGVNRNQIVHECNITTHTPFIDNVNQTKKESEGLNGDNDEYHHHYQPAHTQEAAIRPNAQRLKLALIWLPALIRVVWMVWVLPAEKHPVFFSHCMIDFTLILLPTLPHVYITLATNGRNVPHDLTNTFMAFFF